MATYCISRSERDDYGQSPADRHKKRSGPHGADEHFRRVEASGHFVRMTRWGNGQCTEVMRANEPRR
jgi:hypothetical protein